jgi:hypothetical protein
MDPKFLTSSTFWALLFGGPQTYALDREATGTGKKIQLIKRKDKITLDLQRKLALAHGLITQKLMSLLEVNVTAHRPRSRRFFCTEDLKLQN